jgi:hypothetical protein
MPTDHIVEDGEYLGSIAEKYGFSSYLPMWQHPQNATLKAQRKNPNTLMPGDVVHVPDKEIKEYSGQTEKRHQFIKQQPVLTLRIVARGLDDEPIPNASCMLVVEDQSYNLTTDSKGLVEQTIPPSAHQGMLIIKGETAATDLQIQIHIGYLHPLEEMTGVQGRLNNLGYNAGEVGNGDTTRLKSAVKEFQGEHGMTPDGDWGPPLQAKLKEVYGC